MKLTEFSVAHPVSIVMLIVTLVLLGFISIVGLPIAMFPELEFPVITVASHSNSVPSRCCAIFPSIAISVNGPP